MKNITFKQFLITHSFRGINENGNSEEERMDSSIIRIYYPDNNCINDYRWFEFGMYDYAGDYYKSKQLNMILSEYLLGLYVSSFYMNDRLGLITVYLTEEEYGECYCGDDDEDEEECTDVETEDDGCGNRQDNDEVA